jgi:serine/threonine-protein kinase HipA
MVKEVMDERKKLRTNIHHHAGKGLLDIVRVGTSAGGARAKAIIAYNEKTGDVRSGQIDGLPGYAYWILKFDGAANNRLGDPKGYGKIEYAYYLMATACGISMSECKLLHEGTRTHFMTKRFDRVGVSGNIKLHAQTLCGLAHYDYNDTQSYSYEQALQVMRQIKLPYPDMEQLYRRMVFNVVARNQDDHTKNISFLMDEKGTWRLSPAYDVTYAYDPANKWMKAHQMSINGKHDAITRTDLLAVAKNMDIKKPAQIIAEVIEAVSGWNKYAKQAGVEAEQIKAIKKTFLMKVKS